MEQIVQKWQCPKCGEMYESFLPVRVVTCRSRHKPMNMKLIEGDPSVGRPRRQGVRDVKLAEPPKQRVKAGRISTLEQLTNIMRIGDNHGE